TVDVDGLAEWRSVEGELRVVHQVELPPAPAVRFRWTVTPKLRVVSTAAHHWYHACLYASLADRVDVRAVPYHLLDDPDRLAGGPPGGRGRAPPAGAGGPPGAVRPPGRTGRGCGGRRRHPRGVAPAQPRPPRRARRHRAVRAVGGPGRRGHPPQRLGSGGDHG